VEVLKEIQWKSGLPRVFAEGRVKGATSGKKENIGKKEISQETGGVFLQEDRKALEKRRDTRFQRKKGGGKRPLKPTVHLQKKFQPGGSNQR